jgi:GAF domain-containing protein
MNPSGDDLGAAQFLPELAGLLLSEQSVIGLLDVVVNLAASGIEGVDEASVSLVVGSGPRFATTNASSPTIRTVDEAQYAEGQGPCVEAIRTGQEVSISLPEPRWADFSDAAMKAGVRSVWSLPLVPVDKSTGALNLYSKGERLWEGASRPAARGLARQAAVLLANAATLASAELANRHLQLALENRDVIGQAKGILMARRGVTADQAFDILRVSSQRSGRKLRDVAAEVVDRRGPVPGES